MHLPIIRSSRSLALLACLVAVALRPAGAADVDSDSDGLTDAEEILLGTSPTNPDTDGDGLLDGWEVHGFHEAGFEEPLAIYGADPLRKDIFIEIDWMETASGDASTGASIAYLAAVDIVRTFRRSGKDIAVHIDLGPRIESLVPAAILQPDVDLSAFKIVPDEEKVIPFQEVFPARPPGGAPSTISSLYDLYRAGHHFRPSRRNVFYYVVIAEQEGTDGRGDVAAEGTARSAFSEAFHDDLARRDGLVPTGARLSVVYRKPVSDLAPELESYRYSVRILHELGHAFGLGHGGALPGYRWDNQNYKPNYPSIMNYRFQFCGVGQDGIRPVMDFSRGHLSFRLYETTLIEPVGMGKLPSAHVLQCAGLSTLDVPRFPDNIDWDRDGRLTMTLVVQDINQNGVIDTEPMSDHDDWGKLQRDGFDGIGAHAFRELGRHDLPTPEVTCVIGDFSGDGIDDVFLQYGDRLRFVRGTPEGPLVTSPASYREGKLASWRIGPVSSLLVGDVFGAGRDMVFAHRRREAAVIELAGDAARLRWYEDGPVTGGHEDSPLAWSLGARDRFLLVEGVPGAPPTLAVTNGIATAFLAGNVPDSSEIEVVWSSAAQVFAGAIPERGFHLRVGRVGADGGRSLFLGQGATLQEIRGVPDAPTVADLGSDGRWPSAEVGGGASSGWAISPADELFHVDLDGDGATEIVLRRGKRLGVVAWRDGRATLVWETGWETGGAPDAEWSPGVSDKLIVANLVPGSGTEILVAGTSGWTALGWDPDLRAPRIIATCRGVVEGVPLGLELRTGQALYAGRFLPGDVDQILVQDDDRLALVELRQGEFRLVSRFDGSLGLWGLDRGDRLFPANLDGDPELEILVRRGLILGVLDFWPEPRSLFVATIEPEDLLVLQARPFRRGDVNEDGDVDISDVVAILGMLFLGSFAPPCEDAADIDDDGAVDITDPIALLMYLFNRGVPPPPPGPRTLGIDPTPDDLTCGES